MDRIIETYTVGGVEGS